MTHGEPLTVKAVVRGLVLVMLWALAASSVFLGGVCVWVSVRNFPRPGFWVPALAGGLTIGIMLFSAFRATRALRGALEERSVAAGGSRIDQGSHFL
jgi:hypothetical protein